MDTSDRGAFDELCESDPTFRRFVAAFEQVGDDRRREILELIERVMAEPDASAQMEMLRQANADRAAARAQQRQGRPGPNADLAGGSR